MSERKLSNDLFDNNIAVSNKYLTVQIIQLCPSLLLELGAVLQYARHNKSTGKSKRDKETTYCACSFRVFLFQAHGNTTDFNSALCIRMEQTWLDVSFVQRIQFSRS